MVIKFDRPVDRASVAARLRVDPAPPGCDLRAAFDGKGGGCRVVWSADSSSLRLEHAGALFVPDVKYHFFLDAGVRDPQGTVNGLDHSWELTAAVAPTLSFSSPGDGATGVSVDSSIALGFSELMAPGPTAASISLVPAVPGTRVVVNSRDHSRFVVLPGRLLSAGTTYTVRVGSGAHEEHGAALAAPDTVRFTTGGLNPRAHAVVLARRPGELPSVVFLTGLAAAQPGDPAAAATVREAPRCTAVCGALGPNQPTEAYLAASAAPGGSELALVVRDLAQPALGDRLELLDLGTGETRLLGFGIRQLAWAGDGRQLAFGEGDHVTVYDTASASEVRLPPGDPLDGPPSWNGAATQLALPVRAPGGTPHVELADVALRARYPVPGGAGGAADSPVLSPDGASVALRRLLPGAGTSALLVGLGSADAAPRQLGDDLTPLAWVDAGTLLAVQRPAAGDPGLVRVGTRSGDVERIPGGPRPGDLATAVAPASGRALGYLLPDAAGTLQAWVENSDGSNPLPLTAFGPGDGLEVVAVSVS